MCPSWVCPGRRGGLGLARAASPGGAARGSCPARRPARAAASPPRDVTRGHDVTRRGVKVMAALLPQRGRCARASSRSIPSAARARTPPWCRAVPAHPPSGSALPEGRHRVLQPPPLPGHPLPPRWVCGSRCPARSRCCVTLRGTAVMRCPCHCRVTGTHGVPVTAAPSSPSAGGHRQSCSQRLQKAGHGMW